MKNEQGESMGPGVGDFAVMQDRKVYQMQSDGSVRRVKDKAQVAKILDGYDKQCRAEKFAQESLETHLADVKERGAAPEWAE